MIIASTPLRISLFGGSTDLPAFIEKYGHGLVISFAANLRTYVVISQDTFGLNSDDNKYVLNYSRREEVNQIGEIQNDLVRAALERYPTGPATISLTSDVFAYGSGLASSSSYLISLVKAFTDFQEGAITDSEACAVAYDIERGLNPYCGLQDPYGCGLGGFKLLEFSKDGRVSVEFLPTNFFDEYDCHLIFTGITHESKTVLKDVSRNIDRAQPLLEITNKAYDALLDRKYDVVLDLINEGWREKKTISEMIATNSEIARIDEQLDDDSDVLAYKLCGAGNGGFFACFTPRGSSFAGRYGSVRVQISVSGVESYAL